VPDDLIEIEGAPILSGSRRGKYLLFTTARGTLLIHLGMSGSLRVLAPSIPWRKHDHVAFRLDSGMELRFHDPRRFGTIQWIKGSPSDHPLLKDLGPEPLSPDFSARHLYDLSRHRKSSVKALIMDSHSVVGVGNIYACEALFMAGIRPTLAAGKVSLPRFERLTSAIREVLAACGSGGPVCLESTIKDAQTAHHELRGLLEEGKEAMQLGPDVRLQPLPFPPFLLLFSPTLRPILNE
jgi:formamidopyrimidine-DNA glycosylase